MSDFDPSFHMPALDISPSLNTSSGEPVVDHGKHYRFTFKGLKLDPYRVIDVYAITHPAHQHIVKKALRAGESIKSLEQDIDEIIMSCNRWKEMIAEDKETLS